MKIQSEPLREAETNFRFVLQETDKVFALDVFAEARRDSFGICFVRHICNRFGQTENPERLNQLNDGRII